ncbi:ClpP/crotonase-like domain-containing protein [Coniella lustricola]|uniref:ClpP/crotonase-like domain-containing protein n=1 Tax=Coniella lustricola TaxID=2025994 RepID=A0A2T2ZWD9_9PEZI|nr:ClpP/crotonase-like domain-containing protein [Coniella lustricola]
MSLRSRPLDFPTFKVTFPQDKVVQVTLTRTEKLNCVDKATSQQIAEIWEEFDRDGSLLVGIITGEGRAFCTGADLQEWNEMNRRGVINDMSAPGLAGLPRRAGKKPIIAAVNGICMGGGFEMVANCDLVVASSKAVFSLPEVKRGIVAVAGALPRLTRTLGLQRTMELALTGRPVSAQTLHDWGLVARVVDGEQEHGVVAAALALAGDICANSPDAVVVGRHGIRMSWEQGSVEEAVTELATEWYPRLVSSANFGEGILAFTEKRAPKWVPSKL